MERFPLKKGIFFKWRKCNIRKIKRHSFRKIVIKKKVIIIVLIIVLNMFLIKKSLNSVAPVFNMLIQNKAQSIAISISNNAINEKLSDINYSELIIFEKDEMGKISMISANTNVMNEISNKISILIQEKLQSMDNIYVKLPLGAFLGTNILINIGPKIKIKILPVGTLSTNFKSQFVSTGINQTVHKLYVEVICNVSIITPFSSKSASFVNNVLVSEVVIVGEVPNTFYNLQGVSDLEVKDSMNIFE